jgi:chromatin segregation and condensation protein Rec8/ScpA/Scc1 (kleisin family)
VSKSKPELKLVEDTGSQLQDEDLSFELPPQQSEMPFAVVEGEPMTQLPRDLYIPPDALQVFLTAFEGPLDLLLYLIRKQNIDILNIPIAEITRQYMKYIEVMAEMQLELAGEYLLMAAMLAEIKSRMLLPRPAAAAGTEEDDPRAELVRRLQEYERFKKAAEDIDKLNRLERDNISASAELEERKVVRLLPDVTLKEMLDAFRDVLSRAEKFAHHHISRERLSQRERMTEILARLQTVAFFQFSELFKPEEGRMGVTVTFIAILELMKEGLIEIVQAEAYAPIHVRTAQRHLKVVQGGPAASETADAENVAALSQPELAGENDIPDEDETPAADDAAIAVQAAVADVAAASSIAADSGESDHADVNASFVEAAVSEAVASTESAVETVAEVAATSEEAVAAAVADEVAVGSPVVIDEGATEPAPVEEVVIDSALGETLAASSPVFDEVTLEDVPHDLGPVETTEAVAVVEGIVAVDERVVEEHVVEEHEVEEHVIPEYVVEEHIVPTPVIEESTSQLASVDTAEIATDASIAEHTQVVEDIAAPAETAEIADEPVASSDLPATQLVDEHAQPALDAIEVVADDAPSIEPIEVVAEVEPSTEPIEVAAEGVPSDETTNVAIEDIAVADTAEHNEATTEQMADLSDPDLSKAGDSVTGASDEADNSDAEPTR